MKTNSVGFIGAGKVGVTLGAYLKHKGICVGGYYSKSIESAINAALLTDSTAFDNICDLVMDCDTIFITTPDSQIEMVWSTIKQMNIMGKTIIHTSGSISSKIFNQMDELDAYGYSLHPMYAFSAKDGSFHGLDHAFFTLEGNKSKLEDIKNFFEEIGNRVLIIEEEKKALYHLGNVMASNLVLALIETAVKCLLDCGIAQKEAFEALLPLIKVNVNNMGNDGILHALTGPIERNDVITIKRHLDVVPDGIDEVYRKLSLVLIDISKIKHPEKDYTQIKSLLERHEAF